MKITFEPAALAELEHIYDWIKRDNPRAAQKMVARIKRRIGLLRAPGLAYMGRPGLDPGTNELLEYPYIIVYEVFTDRNEIVVLSIVHGAQDRE